MKQMTPSRETSRKPPVACQTLRSRSAFEPCPPPGLIRRHDDSDGRHHRLRHIHEPFGGRARSQHRPCDTRRLGCGRVVALAGAFVYAELAARRPQVGGQYAYIREAYHPAVAFVYGWALLLVIQSGGMAAVAITFAKYFKELTGIQLKNGSLLSSRSRC